MAIYAKMLSPHCSHEETQILVRSQVRDLWITRREYRQLSTFLHGHVNILPCTLWQHKSLFRGCEFGVPSKDYDWKLRRDRLHQELRPPVHRDLHYLFYSDRLSQRPASKSISSQYFIPRRNLWLDTGKQFKVAIYSVTKINREVHKTGAMSVPSKFLQMLNSLSLGKKIYTSGATAENIGPETLSLLNYWNTHRNISI